MFSPVLWHICAAICQNCVPHIHVISDVLELVSWKKGVIFSTKGSFPYCVVCIRRLSHGDNLCTLSVCLSLCLSIAFDVLVCLHRQQCRCSFDTLLFLLFSFYSQELQHWHWGDCNTCIKQCVANSLVQAEPVRDILKEHYSWPEVCSRAFISCLIKSQQSCPCCTCCFVKLR